MHEIAIDRSQRRLAGGQQIAAHGHDLGGGAGRQIEAPEELMARALDHLLQRGDGGRVGGCQISFRRARDRVGVGLHAVGQEAEELAALLRLERAVAGEDGAGDGDAGRLAAAGEQRSGQLVDVVFGLRAAERARQELAALLGDAAQQLLEEGNVHGSPHSPIL